MKKILIAFTIATSLALMTLPFYALAEEETPTEAAETIVTTATTVNLPIETLPKNGRYNGYFKQLKIGGQPSSIQPLVEVWTGEELDTSGWKLRACYLTPDNSEEMTYKENILSNIAEYVNNDGIPLDSPEYAHCFTVDTSEVDTSTPGYYYVHIRTVPGEKAVFHDMHDPEYSYEITMREYEIRAYVVVRNKPEPDVYLNLWKPGIMDNEETSISFSGNSVADMTGARLTAEPEGIVEIGELALPPSGDYPNVLRAAIKGLKPGTVTITGVTDSGLTTSCTLKVYDHTFGFRGDERQGHEINEKIYCSFYCATDQNVDFTIADESIAKIEKIEAYDTYRIIRITPVSVGETTLIATAADGRTVSLVVKIIPGDPYETTVAWTDLPTTATTTTTTVTAANQKGDLNGDGKVDILDVIRLNKSLLGAEKLTDEQTSAADVDGNGKVESNDSLLILKYALEMIDSF